MITIAFMMTVVVMMAHAQGALKRVYNETIDPMTQIDEGLQKAKAEGKFVICQVGGNWCPWCLRFADFVEKDTAVNKAVNDNFVYLHVNYNPRKKEALNNVGLLNSQIPPRYSTTYFNHVWGGGYAAGYYSYLWTEVLAVNVADYFAKHGALDPAIGQAFRDKVLSRGNTKDQMEMFTDFTGMKEPDASGFLKARGL